MKTIMAIGIILIIVIAAEGKQYHATKHKKVVATTQTTQPANVKLVKKVFVTTGYCPCSICCEGWSSQDPNRRTASGKLLSKIKDKGFFAGPSNMKFGTKIMIPGYHNGKVVTCEDRGGAIKGNRLDLFFNTHKEALQWGVKKLTVTIVNP